jgi:hypothetical protein
MSASVNTELQRVNEMNGLRGFANLFRKEKQTWWGTRRWWVNAILWPAVLGGLVFMMLFMLPPVAEATGNPNVAALGDPISFALEMGRTAFFELGTITLAVGVISPEFQSFDLNGGFRYPHNGLRTVWNLLRVGCPRRNRKLHIPSIFACKRFLQLGLLRKDDG